MTDQEIIETLATKLMGRTVAWVRVTGWNPMEDAEECKQVREKLAERFDWDLSCISYIDGSTCVFRVWLRGDDEGSDENYEFKAQADTEERAVCLCALKTVSGEG